MKWHCYKDTITAKQIVGQVRNIISRVQEQVSKPEEFYWAYALLENEYAKVWQVKLNYSAALGTSRQC